MRSIVAAMAFVAVSAAQASVVQLNGPQVTITVDTNGFAFTRDGNPSSIDASAFTYSNSGNRLDVDFNSLLSANASSYMFFVEDTRSFSLDALFQFTPLTGYAISGYTLSYSGSFYIQGPGSVSSTLGVSSSVAGDQTFSVASYIAGSTPPGVSGSFGAFAAIEFFQVFDGYFEGVPQYHTETNLAEASITLDSVSLEAHLVPVAFVPEPGSLALVGLGFAGLAAIRRRKQA